MSLLLANNGFVVVPPASGEIPQDYRGRGGHRPLPFPDLTPELVEQHHATAEALREWLDERSQGERIQRDAVPVPSIGRQSFDVDAAIARQRQARKPTRIVAPTRTAGEVEGTQDELMILAAAILADDD